MSVITVAAAVIVNAQKQLLVVRKKNTACFMQVGGKLEVGELPEHAMAREIEEEIGSPVEIKSFLGTYMTDTANEPDCQLKSYVFHVELKAEPHIHAEIEEMKWVDLNDQCTLLAPLTRQVVMPWCLENLV